MKCLMLPLLAIAHIAAFAQSEAPLRPPKRPNFANELDTPPSIGATKPKTALPTVIYLKKPVAPAATANTNKTTAPPSASPTASTKPRDILPEGFASPEKPKPKFPQCSEGHYTDNPKDVANMFDQVLGFQHALNQEVIENGGNHTRVLLASQGGKLQFKIDLDYQGFPVSLYAPGKICQKSDGALVAMVATSEAKKRDWMLANSEEVADTYRVTISRVNPHAVRLSEPTGKLNNVFTAH